MRTALSLNAQHVSDVPAFKIGINQLRYRRDKDEAFSGVGDSWEGAFVGGANLVRAFTYGSQFPYGNRSD